MTSSTKLWSPSSDDRTPLRGHRPVASSLFVVLVLPAFLIGASTRRIGVLVAFSVSVVVTSWVAIAGWFAPQVWLAGVALQIGAVVLWQLGPTVVAAVVIGAGAGWAWQPCVGSELAEVLNRAQEDPVAALPGLTAFMIGVLFVGLGLGAVVGVVFDRFSSRKLDRPSAVIVGLLGLSMVVGLYSSIASVFARWNTALWS